MAITIDEMFKKIGEFRQYQWYLMFVMGYCLLTTGAFNLSIVSFITAEPNWKCVEGQVNNISLNNTVCRFNHSITLRSKDYKARCKMPRDAWTYENDFTSTVTEYDLVCEDSILQSVAQSCFWVGMLVGLLIGGFLSDKYGRSKVCCAGIIINVLACVVVVYPKSFIVFIICRIFIGLGAGFENGASFTLITEFTTEKYHSWVGIGYFVFLAVGLMNLPLIGYFAREWRMFLLITAACSLPSLLLCWLIPESPRWLLLNNKEKEARRQLSKVAKMNKEILPDDELEKPAISRQRLSYRELFSSSKVAKKSLICWNLWFTHALVYYGVSYGIVDLGGNRYLNFFLVSFVGFLADFAIIWAINCFGRKSCVISGMIITVVAAAISVSIPSDDSSANTKGRVATAVIAKFFISFSFNGCYVWTSELFPTVVRATAMSTSSATARVGSFAASYVIWLIRIHPALPYGIMGAVCLQAVVLGFFLPETKGRATMETMGDMEQQTESSGIVLSVYPNGQANGRVNQGSDDN